MALIKCTECGKEISDKAASCPNCGCPISDKTTKEAGDQIKKSDNVLITCRRHWVSYVIPGAISLFFIIAGISFFTNGGFKLCLFGIVVFLICCIVIHSDYLSISEAKIIGSRGLINTKKLVSPISKVQGVSLSNGLLGKILGYHTIIVDTAGSGHAEYVYIKMANAKKFLEKYTELSEM